MLIRKKYIALPYNNGMVLKQVSFIENDILQFDLKIKLDLFTPECWAYVDVESLIGKNIKLVFTNAESPGNLQSQFVDEINENEQYPYMLEQLDDIPIDYNNKYRPYVHFTAPYGWLSDPNGLVYADGVYHMFYQFNPAGVERENMHWGHAVSRDLLHWDNLDVALFPDDKGFIFSGSAVADKDNIMGIKEQCTPIMLFYTAAGGTSERSRGEPFTVSLAYSVDGGHTFTRYEGNPILPNIAGKNRDPKVVWCTSMNCYVMALYLEDSRYCLLSSENLVEWKVFQIFTLPGDSECPDLYALTLDGDNSCEYWVFSGASDYYYVGQFQDGQFVSTQPVKKLHYGKSSYAAQTFSNLPGSRVLRFSWQRVEFPQVPFSGQLSILGELKLKNIENELYLCLWPVDEINNIACKNQVFNRVNISKDNEFIQGVPRGALDIFIEASYIPGAIVTIDVLGITITCDMVKNQLCCAESISPMSIKQRKLRLRIILDKNSIELFIDEGEFYMSNKIICDYNLNYLRMRANSDVLIKTLSIAQLQLEDI